MLKKTAVIVGGGFGGVRAALDLARHKYDLKVILIDKNGYHSYPADFYKLLRPPSGRQEHFSPEKFRLMFSSVTISLAEIFEGRESVQILIDEAAGFDLEKNLVNLASGEKIKYDWLILATGSVTNFYDIPGLKPRALEFKTTADALNCRNAVDEVFERKGKHELINIVIGGGGFTGCEVAAELACFTKILAQIHGHPQENILISIVEASSQISGSLGGWAIKKAERRLKKLGIKIILNEPIVDVQDRSVALKSGGVLNFDVLLWTAGVKANPICQKIGRVKFEGNFCLVVDKYLRIGDHHNIFVIGDAAYCQGFDEKPLPMTGQTAISQGAYVAYSIKRILHHRKVFKYHPRESKFIMPLGQKYAIADLGWLKISGFLPWYLKRLVALKYFLSILSFGKAWKLWRLW